MNRPSKRATIGLTAILLFLPNAFWKGEPPRQLRIRVEVRAAEVAQTAQPASKRGVSVNDRHAHRDR